MDAAMTADTGMGGDVRLNRFGMENRSMSSPSALSFATMLWVLAAAASAQAAGPEVRLPIEAMPLTLDRSASGNRTSIGERLIRSRAVPATSWRSRTSPLLHPDLFVHPLV
jgi:hypothetical protein